MAHVLLPVNSDGLIAEAVPCAACSTPLEGERASGLCPGCGDPIAHSLLGRSVAQVDGELKVTETVHCGACGTSLMGQASDGACLNCQTPVAASLEANLLRYANRRWLKKVSDGLVFYVIGLGVAILLTIGNIVASIIIKDEAIKALIGISVTLLSGAFVITAIWWVTTPDPDADLSLQRRRGANLARFLSIPQYVLTLPVAYLAAVAAPGPQQVLPMICQVPIGIMGVLVWIGVLLTFGELARRVVDEKLEGWARTILWINVLSSILLIAGGTVAGVVSALSGASTGTQPAGGVLIGLMVGGGVSCIGLIGAVIATVWMIVLIFCLRGYFARALKMSGGRETSDWR